METFFFLTKGKTSDVFPFGTMVYLLLTKNHTKTHKEQNQDGNLFTCLAQVRMFF